MSTTTQNSSQRSAQKFGADDSFSSMFASPQRKAPGFASATINANTKAQTFISDDLQPSFNDPLLKQSTLASEYVPKREFVDAKRSARDAWFAVTILALFIAGGIYFIAQRVGGDAEKIDTLTVQVDDLGKQLNSERGVVVARNKEIRLLNDQICELKHKAATVRTTQR